MYTHFNDIKFLKIFLSINCLKKFGYTTKNDDE